MGLEFISTDAIFQLKDGLDMHVHNISDLQMPFDGTVILPSENELDFDTMGVHDYLFAPYQYTKKGEQYVFDSLRDLSNRPFKLDKKYICLVATDYYLLDVAPEYLVDHIDDNGSAVDDSTIEFGYLAPATAKVFVIELDGDTTLPDNMPPYTLRKGVSIFDTIEAMSTPSLGTISGTIYSFDWAGLQNETYSALKIVGQEFPPTITNAPRKLTLCYVDIHGEPLSPDDEDDVLNFFLTSLPHPIEHSSLPNCYTVELNANKELSFSLIEIPYGANHGDMYNAKKIFIGLWPGFGFSFKELSKDTPVVFDLDQHVNNSIESHFLRLCVFHPAKELQSAFGGPIDFDDTKKRYFTSNNNFNLFSKDNAVTLFNSGEDFFGDLLQETSSLKDKDKWYQSNWKASTNCQLVPYAPMRGVSPALHAKEDVKAQVKAFSNSTYTASITSSSGGDSYYFSKDTGDDTGDGTLNNPYQSITKLNTLFEDNFFQEGDMILFKRGDDYSANDIDAIASLELINFLHFHIYGDNTLAIPIVKGPDGNLSFKKDDTYIILPKQLSYQSQATVDFKIKALLPSTDVRDKTDIITTYFQKDNVSTLKINQLALDNLSELSWQAYWNTPTHDLRKSKELFTFSENEQLENLPYFPGDFIQLSIDNADPQKARLIRKKSYTDIATYTGDVTNDQLALLIFNVSIGRHLILPLKHNTIDDNASDIPLEWTNDDGSLSPSDELKRIVYDQDELIIAIIHFEEESSLELNLNTLLKTSFRSFQYSITQHYNGFTPLHEGEFGGHVRKVIQKGVDVKVLLWEQTQAHLDSSNIGYKRGEKQNVKISNVINQTKNGKRGYAIIDRATREFGSFHQKATVLIKKADASIPGSQNRVIAYLGGMDLSVGRYDSLHHYSNDPARRKDGWFDVHIKLEGPAALDVLRNFKQRWEPLAYFINEYDESAQDLITNSIFNAKIPRNAQEFPLNDANHNQIKIPSYVSDTSEAYDKGFVQINRTIPPFSPHVDYVHSDSTNDESFSFSDEGELASMESMLVAIKNAKKFIVINDQYFWNKEVALALHNSLKSPDGVDFVVLMLPDKLGENDIMDPLLSTHRKRTIDTLYYGGELKNDQVSRNSRSVSITSPMCGNIQTTEVDEDETPAVDISNQVALLTPIAPDDPSTSTYVHSKHMIVDDVWMMIGSTNIGSRSLTYDWEINATVVGDELIEGATQIVRSQRMEIFRLMVGLPKTYHSLFQDPYLGFKLLKAIEKGQKKLPFPAHPMTKKLDPTYVEYPGEVTVASNPDAAASEVILCSILDPDGRNPYSDRLGYFVNMFDIARHYPDFYLDLTISYSTAARTFIQSHLATEGNSLKIVISLGFVAADGSLPEEYFQYQTRPISISEDAQTISMGSLNKLVIAVNSETGVDIKISYRDQDEQTLADISAGITMQKEDYDLSFIESSQSVSIEVD